MSAARFFSDEDVYAAIAIALRRAGIDAISAPEADRLGESDDPQLEWSALQDRVFVTFDVGHFAAKHAAWIQQGLHHAGIVVSQQRFIGDMLRRLMRLASVLDAAAMRDRLEYSSNW